MTEWGVCFVDAFNVMMKNVVETEGEIFIKLIKATATCSIFL